LNISLIRGVFAAGLLALTAMSSAWANAEETAAVPAQPPAPNGPVTKVTLSAVIADGAKPMRDELLWIVARTDQGGAQVVATQTSAKPQLSLAPGKYLVTAKFGTTEISNEIAIGSEAASHVFNLNSGFVRLRMIPNAGAPAVTGPGTWGV
jgi:hypothetical protein